jgi:hypothetical protein
MFDPPKTEEEAERYRYGEWAGQPRGYAFNPKHCAYEVPLGRVLYCQCGARPGKGPAGLYCGTHANKIARDRERLNRPDEPVTRTEDGVDG